MSVPVSVLGSHKIESGVRRCIERPPLAELEPTDTPAQCRRGPAADPHRVTDSLCRCDLRDVRVCVCKTNVMRVTRLLLFMSFSPQTAGQSLTDALAQPTRSNPAKAEERPPERRILPTRSCSLLYSFNTSASHPLPHSHFVYSFKERLIFAVSPKS